MADEKDKQLNEAVLNYLRALGVKLPAPLHAGTDALMGKSDPALEKLSVEQLNEAIRKLTEADKQKKALETGQVDLAAVNEWLMSHWPMEKRLCPVCQVVQWSIGPSFAQIPINVLGSHSPPRTNPCVAVVCGNCGNTLFFNAIIMGLLPEKR